MSEPNNQPFVTVAVIDNAIEAQLVTSILKERNIPHQMLSHHDTAYDGLYQTQKGWGDIKAPLDRQAEIKQILCEIRKEDE